MYVCILIESEFLVLLFIVHGGAKEKNQVKWAENQLTDSKDLILKVIPSVLLY